MPGKVKVKILSGRNLPVMDRGSLTTDAFVEIKLGSTCFKTEVAKKTLNPIWQSEWFRFEVDDADLQDEPLQIRIMDYDTYSANDAIGKVYISLNPLLLPSTSDHSVQKTGKGSVMSGWIPVYDTLQGIRGEVNIIVKVDLFSDVNKFRQSSCGIQFFYSSCVPHGYIAQTIHGFVEELVVNDDPEYQWIDKIRTPRASNEARHLAFLRLSGQVQRKIGLKAIELGANAVLGYVQNFDLEGDIGVVARGTGTAVTLIRLQEANQLSYAENILLEENEPIQRELLTAVSLIDTCSTFTDTSLIIQKSHSYTSVDMKLESSISNQQSIKALLDQEDNRITVDKNKGYRWKLKPSSFFNKALGRKKIVKEKPFLSSSYTDVRKSLKGSLLDVKQIVDKSQPPTPDGSNMARLLVKSVMVAPLMLASIHEHDDTAIQKSRSLEKCPYITVSTGEIFEGSDNNLSSASASTTTDCTSSLSDSDDEEEGNTSTTQPSEPETVSMVVKSVLELENKHFHTSFSGSELHDVPTYCGKDRNIASLHIIKMPESKACQALNENGTEINRIKPGLANDEPKHDFLHNITDKLHSFQEHIHLPLFQSTGIKHHNNPGLLETAMATILIEKLNICEVSAGITPVEVSEEVLEPKETKVHELRENITETIHNIGSYIHPPHIQSNIKRIFSHGHIKTPVESIRRTQSHPNMTEQTYTDRPMFYNNDDENEDISEEDVGGREPAKAHLTANENRADNIFHDWKEKIHNLSEHLQADAQELKENIVDKIHTLQNKIHFAHNVKTLNPSKEEVSNVEAEIGKIYEIEMKAEEDEDDDDIKHSRKYSLEAFKRRISFSKKSFSMEKPLFGRKPSKDSSDRDSEETIKLELNIPHDELRKSLESIETVKEMEQQAVNRNEALPSSPSGRPFHPRTESTSSKTAIIGSASNVINITRETGIALNRRSSDSDLSITPKGNSLNSGDRYGSVQRTPLFKPALNQDNLEMLEYPFLTITKYPSGFILHLGATVAARSVKRVQRVPNPDEPETRDSWWNELRMEIRSHARAIGCNVVLGYSEVTTITDDVCVLSATGTAAVVNLHYIGDVHTLDTSGSSRGKDALGSSTEKKEEDLCNKNKKEKATDFEADVFEEPKDVVNTPPPVHAQPLCSICHIPYAQSSLPFKTMMSKCNVCHRQKVPDVLLATIELPEGIQITGKGCLIQAHVCRYKRDLKSEANAKEISDGLPFLEYELHRQLICKLKVKGMNAIFGLRTNLAVGERVMALVATGTAVFLTGLPTPKVPKIVAGNSWTDLEKLGELQKTIQDTMEKNRELYQLKLSPDTAINGKTASSDTDDSEDELAELDLTLGHRDTCILEVDDIQDLEVIALLMEHNPPEGFHVANIQSVPGTQDLDLIKHLQMFTQVWRAKIPLNQSNSNFSKHFHRLLQTIFFKLRTMIPCAISGLRFLLELPEADEMQILVTGMAYGLGEPGKTNRFKKRMIPHSISKDGARKLDDDLMFNLDEDVDVDSPANFLHTGSLRLRKKSPTRGKNKIARHIPLRERYGVDITPLFNLPGGQIEKYLGNLNFFFIRESTAIRENGGISGFIHSFITELLAVVRAHVTALGGNAIVSFYMTELMLVDNPHKNQGQCLINVGGDVVFVSDYLDD